MEIFKPTIQDQATFSGSVDISGSLTITQNLNVVGELQGAATTASYISLANVDGFTDVSSSIEQRISRQESFSGSLNDTFATDAELSSVSGALALSISNISTDFDDITNKPTLISSSAQIAADISGSFTDLSSSLVADYLKNTSDTLTGDLTVTGTLTAQDLHVQEITSSIVYSSGSNTFGASSSDIQTFYGSVGIGTPSPSVKLTVDGGVRLTGTTSADSQLDLPVNYGALRWYDGSTFKGGIGTYSWSTVGSANDLTLYLVNGNFHISNTNSSIITTFDRANQRVGIGTESPAEKLHIHGTNGQGLNITGGTNNRNMLYTNANVDFRATTVSGWAFGLRSYTNDGSTLMSYVGGAYGNGPLSTDFQYNFYGGTAYNNAAMYIPASKNVGIGVTSPANKLHVRDGAIGVQNGRFFLGGESGTANDAVEFYKSSNTVRLYVNNGAFAGTYSAGAAALELYSGASYAVRIDGNGSSYFNGGDVGIGNTSPNYNLHVATTSDTYVGISNQGTANGDRQLRLGFGNGHTYATIQGTRQNTADDIDVVLQSGGGNVGIGTTSPAGKLEVRYDTTANNQNYIFSTFRTGSNSSYNGTGLHINAIPSNNTGDTGISYLSLESRYKYLNGNHGTSAFITNTPGTGTSFGDGQIDFFIRDNTAPYTFKNDPNSTSTYWMDPVMTVRSDGAVLKPNLPGFSVYLGNSTTSNGNLIFTGVYYNTGNHYSTSSGRFTAPVAGTYFFYWGSILRTSSGTYRLKLHRNGSQYGWNNTNGNVELRGQVAASTSYETNASRVFTHYLNAYDYVQVALTTSPSSVGVYGDEWTYFGGYLLS